jgi:hypothetical protein
MNSLLTISDPLRSPKLPILQLTCCGNCAEFQLSDRTPSVGLCWLHQVRVLAQDKACSQYYREVDVAADIALEPNDEF